MSGSGRIWTADLRAGAREKVEDNNCRAGGFTLTSRARPRTLIINKKNLPFSGRFFCRGGRIWTADLRKAPGQGHGPEPKNKEVHQSIEDNPLRADLDRTCLCSCLWIKRGDLRPKITLKKYFFILHLFLLSGRADLDRRPSQSTLSRARSRRKIKRLPHQFEDNL